jgi:hypothetical protein
MHWSHRNLGRVSTLPLFLEHKFASSLGFINCLPSHPSSWFNTKIGGMTGSFANGISANRYVRQFGQFGMGSKGNGGSGFTMLVVLE